MSTETEQLAREIARRGARVVRVPRLRATFAQTLVVASFTTAVFLWWKGFHFPLAGASPATWLFAVAVASMTLAGAGASVAALALAVPGREAAARAGLVAALAGLALGALGVPLLFAAGPGIRMAPPPAMDLWCLLWACGVGFLPAVVSLWFVAGAAPHRPLLAVLVASAGAVGLGAVVAQAACPYDGMRHLLLGHALAPVLGGLLLAVPLTLLWRVLRRGS